DFVPVGAADDGQSHWELSAEGLELALEVQEHPLRGLRPQVGPILPGRTNSDGEHHVEFAGRTQDTFTIRASDLELLNPGVDLQRREPFFFLMGRGLEELVAAIRLAAARACDQD